MSTDWAQAARARTQPILAAFTAAADAAFADAQRISDRRDLAAYLEPYRTATIELSPAGRTALAKVAGVFVAVAVAIDDCSAVRTPAGHLQTTLRSLRERMRVWALHMADGRHAVDPFSVTAALNVPLEDTMSANAAAVRLAAEAVLIVAIAPPVRAEDLRRHHTELERVLRRDVLPVAGRRRSASEAALVGVDTIVDGITVDRPASRSGVSDEPGARLHAALTAAATASLWLLSEPALRNPGGPRDAAAADVLAEAGGQVVTTAAVLLASSDGRARIFATEDVVAHLKSAITWIGHGHHEFLRGALRESTRHDLAQNAARSLLILTHIFPLQINPSHTGCRPRTDPGDRS